jgi:hypothetical protein
VYSWFSLTTEAGNWWSCNLVDSESFFSFHKQAKQSEVVLAKELNTVIETVPFKPAPNHPWRTFNLSKNKSRSG